MNIDELYVRYIKPLPPAEQRALLARMERELARDNDDPSPLHDVLELEGLGAEIWQGVDAQVYVHALRDAWETRL